MQEKPLGFYFIWCEKSLQGGHWLIGTIFTLSGTEIVEAVEWVDDLGLTPGTALLHVRRQWQLTKFGGLWGTVPFPHLWEEAEGTNM